MKGATQSAQKLKALFRSLRSSLGKPPAPVHTDPITQLVLGIFTRDAPENRARDALDRLRSMVVDYNELRVIPPLELADIVGDYPDVRTKCEDLSRALNRIFAIEHAVSLDRLTSASRKEVAAYLARIDGLEPYTIARIRLYGLEQHAIPLDEAMWAYARQTHAVATKCPLDEAQSFLERQIAEGDAHEFVALLRKQAWQEWGAAVRKGDVERIRSVPPDRTSRNMLAQVSASAAAAQARVGELAAAADSAARPAARKSRSRKPAAAAPSAGNGAQPPTATGKAAGKSGGRTGRPAKATKRGGSRARSA
jgi:endonuclease III-like uncharacterized protein